MYREISLLFLLVFYGDCELVYGLNSGSIPQTICKRDKDCILLKDCQVYMNFIEALERPLIPPVVEFLRSQQCGFKGGYPMVCCIDYSKDGAFTTLSPKKDYKTCDKNGCVLLKNCKPYMDVISKTEKPLKPPLVEFLRTQQCGFEEGYPKVCCSSLPAKLKALKHTRPESKSQLSEQDKQKQRLEVIDISTKPQTTTESSKSSQNEVNKAKAEAINQAFDLIDFFDFTGSFDLLRRKRFDSGSLLQIEIR